MIDRDRFFATTRARVFGGPMTAGQLQGCTAILAEWDRRALTDVRQLSYMLATAYWETDRTIQPIAEYGRGQGRPYGVPAGPYGHIYYGRSLVQLTWLANYLRMTQLLGARFGVDLVKDPDKALVMEIAVAIMFEGMLRADSHVGDFTGVALEDYFNASKADWLNARRVINGTDRAAEIATIGRQLWSCLGGPLEIRNLFQGNSGPDVKLLQSVLKTLGFYDGLIDGDFGDGTRGAVIAFQRKKHLDVDGEVGPATRTELGIAA